MNGSTADRLDASLRWRVEFRPPAGGRWMLLGTTGSREQAFNWLSRFGASGSFRVEPPRSLEGRRHARA